MKLLFFLLPLICICSGLLDWKSKDKLKKTLARLKSNVDVDRLLKIREKIDKYVRAPKLSMQQKTLLKQKLKEVKPLENNNVGSMGETIEKINERAGMSAILYQGDILLTEDEADELIEAHEGFRSKRQATTIEKKKWPKLLYFSLRAGASDQLKVSARKGALMWHDNTCIDMVENDTAPHRVEIFEGTGCWSYIGNLRQVQELSLGEGCQYYWKAAHELAHALGLFHVQSRYDRDNYVTINAFNIPPAKYEANFDKETAQTSNNYGIPYDYGSRMHYSADAFATDGKIPAIVPKDLGHVETLGSTFLSFYDLLLMNKHYGCLDKCKADSSAAKCETGGYPNPRDCSKCICPGGYGGPLCNERPSGCGKKLTAKDTVQTLTYMLGEYDTKLDDYEKCVFWIEADKGRGIELTVKEVATGFTDSGCTSGGVEIKSQEDQLMTGYRFCKKDNAGRVFSSKTHRVPVILYRIKSYVDVVLDYRMV